MKEIDRLKLSLRAFGFENVEIIRDALALFVPIFAVVGMIMISVKLWHWILN